MGGLAFGDDFRSPSKTKSDGGGGELVSRTDPEHVVIIAYYKIINKVFYSIVWLISNLE